MPKQARIQYTIRGVPRGLDKTIRNRARESGRSVNQVALEAMARGLDEKLPKRDLSFIVGTMSKAESKKIEAAIKWGHRVDRKLWR